MKAHVHTKTYMQIIITPLFVMARNWKQSKCPSCEWINKLWYVHKMVLLGSKNKLILHNSMDESQNNCAEEKKNKQ